jgi:hypothetical protein
MQATNGLGVILENRYYGESFPFNDSSTDHLAFLTTEQSLSPSPKELEGMELTDGCSNCG